MNRVLIVAATAMLALSGCGSDQRPGDPTVCDRIGQATDCDVLFVTP